MKTSIVFAFLFVALTQANKLSYQTVDNGGIVGLITSPTSEDIDVQVNLPTNVEVLGTFSGTTHASKDNSQSYKFLSDDVSRRYKTVQSDNNLVKDTAQSLYNTLEDFATKAFNSGVNYGVNLEKNEQQLLSNMISDEAKFTPTFERNSNVLSSSQYEAKINELEDQQDTVAVESFSYGLAMGLEVGAQAAMGSSALSNQPRSSVNKPLNVHPKLSKFAEARNSIQRKLNGNTSSNNLSSNQSKFT